VALVTAQRAGKGTEAVEIARKQMDILHGTMSMGLEEGATPLPS
jgi:hypothetical protein